MWHTALLAPWFVSSALVCGTALVLVVVIALRRAGYLELEQRHVVKLAKMLGAFVLVDLYFFGCDLLTEGFPEARAPKWVAMLTSGSLAPFFWVKLLAVRLLRWCALFPNCVPIHCLWLQASWPSWVSSASVYNCSWEAFR